MEILVKRPKKIYILSLMFLSLYFPCAYFFYTDLSYNNYKAFIKFDFIFFTLLSITVVVVFSLFVRAIVRSDLDSDVGNRIIFGERLIVPVNDWERRFIKKIEEEIEYIDVLAIEYRNINDVMRTVTLIDKNNYRYVLKENIFFKSSEFDLFIKELNERINV